MPLACRLEKLTDDELKAARELAMSWFPAPGETIINEVQMSVYLIQALDEIEEHRKRQKEFSDAHVIR